MKTVRTWKAVSGLVVAIGMLCISVPEAKADAYGDTKWVSSAGGPTSVKPPWVIIQETGTQYRIEYVGGAAYGARVVVTLHSAVPTGWIIDSVLGGTPGYRYLEYVTGAPYNTFKTVESDSPVPTGWVIVPSMGYAPGTRVLKCVIGAPYQALVSVTLDSPVPTGWVITTETSTNRWITYVVGASYGTTILVVLDSPVPAGWLINWESNTQRRLIYTVGATYGAKMTVVLRSDVPTNWVITREDSVSRDLMYVAGAAYQAKVGVTVSSPTWPNWVIIDHLAPGRTLEFVGGAPQGTVITVTLDSPVPTGWVVTSTGATTRTIQFGQATLLPAPTGLAGVKGGGFIQLTWNAVAGAVGYNVEQRIAKTDPYVAIARSITVNHYTDTDVGSPVIYYYVVTAIGPDGRESLPSNEIAVSPLADPDAPTNVVAVWGDSQVTISWTAPAGAVYYNVKRSTVSKGPYTTVANMIKGTSFVDVTVTNGTKYYYVVTAINAKNIESGPSVEVSAMPNIPPAAPSDLTAVAGNRTVSLSWSPSTGPDVIGYALYRQDSSASSYSIVQALSATTFADNSVVNGVFYTYVVRAVNSSLQEGPNSNIATATPVGPPPPASPSGLAAIGGDSSVALSWWAVSGAVYYNVKRSTASGGPFLVTAVPTTTTYNDTGLTNGTTYYYVVSAVDSTGAQSVNSSVVSAQPYASTSVPAAPSNLKATGGIELIQLTWDVVGGATSYKVYRAPTGTGPWSEIGPSQTNSYTDNSVLFGEIYYYTVSAINPIGEGPQCDAVSATTQGD